MKRNLLIQLAAASTIFMGASFMGASFAQAADQSKLDGADQSKLDGIASIYFDHGSKTANGERVDVKTLTAAHKSLPFGTKVRITNRKNGRSVVVRINDRGPFVRGRVIDVTPAGARALGFAGLTQVTLDVLPYY